MRLKLAFGFVTAALLVLLWQSLKPIEQNSGPELHQLSFDLALVTATTPPITLKLTQGDLVDLTLSSDYDAAVHVHGAEQHIEIDAGQTVSRRFQAEPSGRFVIEVHGSELQLATLEIYPR